MSNDEFSYPGQEYEPDLPKIKALVVEMSRDPAEGLTARQRALMACIVLPQAIQQWMIDAGALEPLLDSIEATISAAENHSREREAERLRFSLEEIVRVGTWTGTDECTYTSHEGRIARAALGLET